MKVPHGCPPAPIDEERSQSRARMAICIVSLLGFLVIGRGHDLLHEAPFAQGLTTILAYSVFSVGWYLFVLRTPHRLGCRRYVSMFTDLGIVTIFMHLGAQHVPMYYPIFLWVIIGNGIRFGMRFLIVGVGMGALGLGSLLAFNDYWRMNFGLGFGLLVGVIVLPAFFLTVLRRLQAVNRLQVELAESKLAEKAKDQFLANMSHEIRTPMNGVLGMAELLQDTELNTEQQEFVHVINRSVRSLLNIINDILDYSKINAKGLSLESIHFDLKQVLTDVYLLLGAAAEDKGIELHFHYPEDAPRDFRGDPTRVRQIVFNLVGNAIKFTPRGHVRLSCAPAGDSREQGVVIEVADSGIGIPADRLSAVFDVFVQADDTVTRQYGGTGLGLTISRELARSMGGDIHVRSRVGEGSTFTVSLPLQQCEAPPQRVAERSRELPNFGLHALVVEDNVFNRAVTQKMLRRIGVTSDVAENGVAALEMLELIPYDLVFMDLRMPVMNGYEATRRIRARQDERGRVPILALTAEGSRKTRQRCLSEGMDAHLAKPMQILEIVDAISSIERLQTPTAV